MASVARRSSTSARPSKCSKSRTTFSAVAIALRRPDSVWLDSGADCDSAFGFGSADQMKPPWAVQPPRSHYLPIVLHKHTIALKWHLAAPAQSDIQPSARAASHLPTDYGRSLRPAIMAQDALYALTEGFALAASSQSQFLNLIDAKLDGCTSANMPPERNWESLPNLRYAKQVLHRYTNATRQALNGIRSASTHPKWPHNATRTAAIKAKATISPGTWRHGASRTQG